ncbi:TPT-domain-containing protein [Obba rivulosa]|uniref:TPT-domain-containing protein n=1 Tax=Obba rivulosa TaxID=1052685 RepID=A0A8E2B336_9APHY|nr:TPT-domain-containing protein [Obba rivulosa]
MPSLDVRWSDFPQAPHPNSSPRQRAGFTGTTPTITVASAESVPHSPAFSDSGLPSPSLPVHSPYASALAKHPARPRKRSRARGRLARAQRSLGCINSQILWLVLYFGFNLGLTLYNKGVLVRFPFPYTLTALHALCGSVGGWLLRRHGAYVPARLSARSELALAAFSVLYAVNIAVSNMSLQLVTVPFHQVVRAATPIFTTALSIFFFGTQFSNRKISTLIPVICGVALATYGDYYFTVSGLLLTLFGTFLAALKTIYTNVVQSRGPVLTSTSGACTRLRRLLPPRLGLHPLDLLTRMSPLACVQCIFYAYLSGELAQLADFIGRGANASAAVGLPDRWGWTGVLVLLGNGVIAFGLNVVSLTANGRVGALSMTVAANVKQALTILCAVVLFELTITPLNSLGIGATLAGGAWYAFVEYQERKRARG